MRSLLGAMPAGTDGFIVNVFSVGQPQPRLVLIRPFHVNGFKRGIRNCYVLILRLVTAGTLAWGVVLFGGYR